MKKDFTYTGYNNKVLENARQLRKNMTPQERHLWYDFLRSYSAKFYRQRPIDFYVADFYCSAAKLVIELDGSQHYTPQGTEYDDLRTTIINLYGVKVIRFSNYDIDNNFYGVCETIDREVERRMKKG